MCDYGHDQPIEQVSAASILYLILLCNVFAVIDVDLEEDHIIHGLVHLLQVGGDHLAGAAPRDRDMLDDQHFSSCKARTMWRGSQPPPASRQQLPAG